MIKELIEKCRTYRRFDESRSIDESELLSFIKNAANTPSGSNLQPLKYKIVTEKKDNAELFKNLKWAGYLTDWSGPEEGRRPAGYIIVLGDLEISKNFSTDLGIASYALVLSAAEKGIGSCMIGSVDRNSVREYFDIPRRYDILLVIAFGYPDEKVVLERVVGDSVKYYRDEDEVHHVPKRDIDELVLV
jgi:nitroreductase